MANIDENNKPDENFGTEDEVIYTHTTTTTTTATTTILVVVVIGVITFRTSGRRREMYCGHERLCVRLFV